MLDSILGKMAEAEVAFSEVVTIVDNFSGFNALVFAISKADLVLAGFFGEELLAFSSILGFLEEALLGKAFLFSRLDGIVGVELTIGGSFISFEEEDVIEMPASFLEEELVDLAGKMGSFTPETLLAEEEEAKVSLLSSFRSSSIASTVLGSSRMLSMVSEGSARLPVWLLASCLEWVSISKTPGKISMEGERNSISTPVVSLDEGLASQPGGQLASLLHPSSSSKRGVISLIIPSS